ncbi:MAG: phosphodiester glycosidase family protein [Lachnospiraceae bacterium]|nr:phosphodiester glycosidase family protein [Lachnospiraceae bacterium]
MQSSSEWKKIRRKQLRQRVMLGFVLIVVAGTLFFFGALLKHDASAEDAATVLEPAAQQAEVLKPLTPAAAEAAAREITEISEEDEGTPEEESGENEPVPTQAPKREYRDWLVDVRDEYDSVLGNYEVINVSGFHPYVFAPDGAGSESPANVLGVTKLVEKYGKSEHIVLALNAGIFYDNLSPKVYCFAGKQPDGILIAGGTVLKSVETVDHTECEPLVIDEDGNVGWTDYYADADALARGDGYYYDIHGNKVTGKKIISAVCGFVPILVDGKNLYDAEDPLGGYHNYVNHYFGRWERQVLGVKEDGSFVILTVTTRSWSLKMAADAALAEGCVFAYNLDGGFSIETVVSDFKGEVDRIETLNLVHGGNQIPACLVFTDDGIAPVSAVPESLTVEAPETSLPVGVSLAGIAASIKVKEVLSNANGHSSVRDVYSYLTFPEGLTEHSVKTAMGDKKKISASPGGNYVYTKTGNESWASLSMNDNTRSDGKYYDYGSGYTLSTRDDLNSPGEKRITVSYDPGGGWNELTAEFTITVE